MTANPNDTQRLSIANAIKTEFLKPTLTFKMFRETYGQHRSNSDQHIETVSDKELARYARNGDTPTHVERLRKPVILKDELGIERKVRLAVSTLDDGTKYHTIESTAGDVNQAVFSAPMVIDREDVRFSTTTKNNTRFQDDFLLYMQQTNVLYATANALEEGDTQNLHNAATGTGKTPIGIAITLALHATGLKSVTLVPTQQDANQYARDSANMDKNLKKEDHKGEIAVSTERTVDEVMQAKHAIITFDDLPQFIEAIKESGAHVTLDEAHLLEEYYPDIDYHDILGEENCVTAVTATPTRLLLEKYGSLKTDINMYKAEHDFRAFRPTEKDPKKILFQHAEEDDIIFELLVDAFAHTSYHRPEHKDFKLGTYANPVELAKDETILDPAYEALKRNEISVMQSQNLAFARNDDIIARYTTALNEVFDGTYERMEELAEAVSKRRADYAITELQKLEGLLPAEGIKATVEHANGTTSEIPTSPKLLQLDDGSDDPYNHVRKDYAVTKEGLHQEVQTQAKQLIADEINRFVLARFREVSGLHIWGEEVRGETETIMRSYDTRKQRWENEGIAPEDPRHRRILEKIKSPDSETYKDIKEKLAAFGLERKLDQINEEGFTALITQAKDIDLSRIEGYQYAVALPKNSTEDDISAVRDKILARESVHLVSHSALGTGFSDKFILSMQRIVSRIPKGAKQKPDIEALLEKLDVTAPNAEQQLHETVTAFEGIVNAAQFTEGQKAEIMEVFTELMDIYVHAEAVEKGAQIAFQRGGRPVREYGHIAMSRQHNLPSVNKEGKLGVDQPFSITHVYAQNSTQLTEEYMDNAQQHVQDIMTRLETLVEKLGIDNKIQDEPPTPPAKIKPASSIEEAVRNYIKNTAQRQ